MRFADTPKAVQIWAMIEAGILTSVSVGFRKTKADEDVEEPPAIERWLPFEISVVCLPADWTARFCREIPADEVDRVAAAALSQRQTELREAVRVHRRTEWQDLARTLAPGIAARLGVDAAATSAALVDAVAEQLGP